MLASLESPKDGAKRRRKGERTRTAEQGESFTDGIFLGISFLLICFSTEASQSLPNPSPPRADLDSSSSSGINSSRDGSRSPSGLAEETVRQFLALPVDQLVRAAKKVGGSPGLHRFISLGEKAREYFERLAGVGSSP
jgi:hypothetical protein